MNDDNNTKEVRDRNNSESSKKSSVLGVTLALLLAIGAFFSGLQVDKFISAEGQTAGLFSFFAKPEVKANEVDLTEFWNVWNLLDQKFISASTTGQLSSEDKVYGAIKGLVGAYGDPYTVFLPPEDSEAFAEDISGNFSGIGMEVGNRDGVVSVIAPLKDTPAYRAGLLAGDVIVKIDEVSTEGMSIDEAVRRIRGEKGTVVTLSIFREGNLELTEFKVTRDTISIPTVKSEQKGKTFIISLYSFNALAELKIQEALREYVRSDAENIVLDLRGNPGGYLQSAVAIASFFLPTGKVIVKERQGEGGEEKLYRSTGKTLQERAPKKMVVLIDKGSASASEILAGALQEHGYATLIGTDSYGKGSVQELVPIDGGSSLKVTVARWFTPNDTSISDGGLKPDILIKRTPEQRINDEDPQLEAGLRFLKGEEVVADKE